MSENTLTLSDPNSGRSANLPIIEGTQGDAGLDIAKLHKDLGMFTYDPGFLSTCSTKSAITFIDGDKGILQYRGYPIEQLAEQSSFLEVAYLLINGELPNKAQFEEFEGHVTRHTMIHEKLKNFISGFHHNAHPMAMLVGCTGSLAAFYHDSLDPNNPEHRLITAIRLIAKMPTIAAACYKASVGQPIMYPKNNLPYCSRFLDMMFGVPAETYEVDPIAAKAMDLLFILHADHEQNASTSTVRLVGSTGANPIACIAAGVAALWGPAHGGANEAVLDMLSEIGTKENVKNAVIRAKDKNDNFRLMGFGHRVYKNFDPRATIIRKMTHEVLGKMGIHDPLVEVAMELEHAALNDDYFKERKLYPNVDFYSGIIYKALNIPVELFTVMFAIARTTGWIAHWMEQNASPDVKIGRPRQIYTGYTARDYVPTIKRP